MTKNPTTEPTKEERLRIRNEKVEADFVSLEKKHPQWRVEELYKEVARLNPPLSWRTVQAIITGSWQAARDRKKQQKQDPNQMQMFDEE